MGDRYDWTEQECERLRAGEMSPLVDFEGRVAIVIGLSSLGLWAIRLRGGVVDVVESHRLRPIDADEAERLMALEVSRG